jgi:ankyrin repeat protein
MHKYLAFLSAANCDNTNPRVFDLPVARGADVNASARDGYTPLMAAARHTSVPEVVSLLLKAGADPKARAKDGKTALDCAKENSSLKGTPQLKALEAAAQ